VRTFALLCLLVVVLAAGCGGSVSMTHSLAKTRACLEQKGAKAARPKRDFVASTASAGTFRAYLHGPKGNFVTLSFGADPAEAQALADGYNHFHGKNIGVTDILFTDKNVTLLWKEHPTSGDAALVSGCLK
jgi:flagellar basal body-associated protein FliL